MDRITPEIVLAAYEATGAIPVKNVARVEFTDGSTYDKYKCPIAVLTDTDTLPDIQVQYRGGFITAIDNSEYKSDDMAFILGHQDGTAVRIALGDKLQDGREIYRKKGLL